MLGVLRAKVEIASEAATSRLPRRRVGGLAGWDGGAEVVGEVGGVSASLREGVVDAADNDCIVCGLFELRRDSGGLEEAGDATTGEYVTNVLVVSVGVGCAANGSATEVIELAAAPIMYSPRPPSS